MKRGRFDELVTQRLDTYNKTDQWLRLVERYRGDAIRKLCKNLRQLSGLDLSRLAKKWALELCHLPVWHTKTQTTWVLRCKNQVYLWLDRGVLYYYYESDESRVYPVEDESLWPWVQKTKTKKPYYLTRDVLANLICMKDVVGPNELRSLRLVCKQWKDWIDGSPQLWQRKATLLAEHFPWIPDPSPSKDLFHQFGPLPVFSTGKQVGKWVRDQLSRRQQVAFFAGLYAPFCPDLTGGHQTTPNWLQDETWCLYIYFKPVPGRERPIPRLKVYQTSDSQAMIHVNWDGAYLKSKKGLSFLEIYRNFKRLMEPRIHPRSDSWLTPARKGGSISHWKK